jgi:alkylation response protein AidB-like acyl-CoA dehydrogenase
VTTAAQDELLEIRRSVRELCDRFPGEYWRSLEPDRYPDEFVRALTDDGWLAALVPEEHGGAGLGLTAASVILEEINASGGNAAACHAQMYTMGTLLRHGSEEQKRRYLPRIAAGELRLQAFGVTEPTAGSDTTRIQTSARRVEGGHVIRGQKIWTSRALHSDLMLLLARTTPLDEVERKSDGMSVFLIDMKAAGDRLTIRPIATMMNHATTEVFLDDVEVPDDALVGAEGEGFRYILDGMNAERILLAAECIGDGRWFVEKAVRYANERVVFGRPIGANQGVQSPIARARRARGGRPRALPRRVPLRAGAPVRRRGEHGEAARVGGVLAGGERLPRHARRRRVRRGVRRRAQVPRDAPLLRRARLEQPRARLHRPARAGPAALVLSGVERRAGPTSAEWESPACGAFR